MSCKVIESIVRAKPVRSSSEEKNYYVMHEGKRLMRANRITKAFASIGHPTGAKLIRSGDWAVLATWERTGGLVKTADGMRHTGKWTLTVGGAMNSRVA